MARASMQAGMAFNGAGLGVVHAISHQVGGTFGVPHGLANAIILPYAMEYNIPQVPDLMVDVADALGEDVDRSKPATVEGYKAVRATRRLADAVRIPRTLAETDAAPDATTRLAEQALDDGSLTGNPRTTDQADIEGSSRTPSRAPSSTSVSCDVVATATPGRPPRGCRGTHDRVRGLGDAGEVRLHPDRTRRRPGSRSVSST